MTEALRSCVHTHTTFCDGASTPEETVQAALGLGFVSLGFSGHGAAAYDDAAMTPAAEVQYRREILRLGPPMPGSWSSSWARSTTPCLPTPVTPTTT